jgi:rhodanese-related sulfurtransferase
MNSNKASASIAPLLLIMTGVLLIASIPLIRYLQNTGYRSNHKPSSYSAEHLSNISANEAALLFEKEMAVFLDVSPMSRFQEGHIPGAINIPVEEIKNGSSTLNPDSWIILYSTHIDVEAVTQAGKVLLKNGFSHVNILEGGFTNWKDQGYPVSTQP